MGHWRHCEWCRWCGSLQPLQWWIVYVFQFSPVFKTQTVPLLTFIGIDPQGALGNLRELKKGAPSSTPGCAQQAVTGEQCGLPLSLGWEVWLSHRVGRPCSSLLEQKHWRARRVLGGALHCCCSVGITYQLDSPLCKVTVPRFESHSRTHRDCRIKGMWG